MGLLEWFQNLPETVQNNISESVANMGAQARARQQARQALIDQGQGLLSAQWNTRHMDPFGAVAEGFGGITSPVGGSLTKFEAAHLAAQKNAAKPIKDGGLGLGPNNTAAERAAALGFDTSGTHYMPQNMVGNSFDEKMVAKNDYGSFGQGIYIDPSKEAGYSNAIHYLIGNEGGNTIPVVFRKGNYFNADNLPNIDNAEKSAAITKNLKANGFDTVEKIVDGKPSEYVVFNPAHIRSRFAAFDPAKINSKDLLASFGGLLGLGAAADQANQNGLFGQ